MWDEIVLDIETTSQFVKHAKLRLWGILDVATGQIEMGTGVKQLQPYIDNAKVIIGHNIKGYDIPVLENHGMDLPYGKVLVDTLEVLRPRPMSENDLPGKGRAAIIGELGLSGMTDNRLPNFKLGVIIEHFKKIFAGRYAFETSKGEFDYKKLRGFMSPQDWEECKTYLEGDLKATRDLYLFLDDYFKGFLDFLPPDSAQKKHHITASTASIGYKAICYQLGLEETYGEKVDEERPGAFVLEPQGESFEGNGYCIDFSSQHPHHMWCANLFTPASPKEIIAGDYYNGDGKIFKLDGKYSIKRHGPIEKFLRWLYFTRLFYQRKAIRPDSSVIKFKAIRAGDVILRCDSDTHDMFHYTVTEKDEAEFRALAEKGVDPRQYTVKIVINAMYGLSYSPVFAAIYNETTGRDTIHMSVQSSAFMKDWMTQDGYNIVYGDTDSLYLFDPHNDKTRMLRRIKEGISQIKDSLPFDDPTYDMTIDDEFSHIFFFKNAEFDPRKPQAAGNWEYLKKTYIYITHDGKVKLKGGKIIKNDATLLGKKIFTEYLLPVIKKEKQCKFDKDAIRGMIDTELKNDITLIARGVNIKPAKFYKLDTQFQAQVAKMYGEGYHYLVKNSARGAGRGDMKYCTIEDAKGLPLSSIDTTKVWSELQQFIREETQQEKLASWF